MNSEILQRCKTVNFINKTLLTPRDIPVDECSVNIRGQKLIMCRRIPLLKANCDTENMFDVLLAGIQLSLYYIAIRFKVD